MVSLWSSNTESSNPLIYYSLLGFLNTPYFFRFIGFKRHSKPIGIFPLIIIDGLLKKRSWLKK